MKNNRSPLGWISGKINWYDPHSGKGSIIGDDGIWYRIHEFCEIKADKIKTLKEKTRVEFALAKDSVHPIVKSIRQTQVEMNRAQDNSKSEDAPALTK